MHSKVILMLVGPYRQDVQLHIFDQDLVVNRLGFGPV